MRCIRVIPEILFVFRKIIHSVLPIHTKFQSANSVKVQHANRALFIKGNDGARGKSCRLWRSVGLAAKRTFFFGKGVCVCGRFRPFIQPAVSKNLPFKKYWQLQYHDHDDMAGGASWKNRGKHRTAKTFCCTCPRSPVSLGTFFEIHFFEIQIIFAQKVCLHVRIRASLISISI